MPCKLGLRGHSVNDLLFWFLLASEAVGPLLGPKGCTPVARVPVLVELIGGAKRVVAVETETEIAQMVAALAAEFDRSVELDDGSALAWKVYAPTRAGGFAPSAPDSNLAGVARSMTKLKEADKDGGFAGPGQHDDQDYLFRIRLFIPAARPPVLRDESPAIDDDEVIDLTNLDDDDHHLETVRRNPAAVSREQKRATGEIKKRRRANGESKKKRRATGEIKKKRRATGESKKKRRAAGESGQQEGVENSDGLTPATEPEDQVLLNIEDTLELPQVQSIGTVASSSPEALAVEPAEAQSAERASVPAENQDRPQRDDPLDSPGTDQDLQATALGHEDTGQSDDLQATVLGNEAKGQSDDLQATMLGETAEEQPAAALPDDEELPEEATGAPDSEEEQGPSGDAQLGADDEEQPDSPSVDSNDETVDAAALEETVDAAALGDEGSGEGTERDGDETPGEDPSPEAETQEREEFPRTSSSDDDQSDPSEDGLADDENPEQETQAEETVQEEQVVDADTEADESRQPATADLESSESAPAEEAQDNQEQGTQLPSSTPASESDWEEPVDTTRRVITAPPVNIPAPSPGDVARVSGNVKPSPPGSRTTGGRMRATGGRRRSTGGRMTATGGRTRTTGGQPGVPRGARQTRSGARKKSAGSGKSRILGALLSLGILIGVVIAAAVLVSDDPPPPPTPASPSVASPATEPINSQPPVIPAFPGASAQPDTDTVLQAIAAFNSLARGKNEGLSDPASRSKARELEAMLKQPCDSGQRYDACVVLSRVAFEAYRGCAASQACSDTEASKDLERAFTAATATLPALRSIQSPALQQAASRRLALQAVRLGAIDMAALELRAPKVAAIALGVCSQEAMKKRADCGRVLADKP